MSSGAYNITEVVYTEQRPAALPLSASVMCLAHTQDESRMWDWATWSLNMALSHTMDSKVLSGTHRQQQQPFNDTAQLNNPRPS